MTKTKNDKQIMTSLETLNAELISRGHEFDDSFIKKEMVDILAKMSMCTIKVNQKIWLGDGGFGHILEYNERTVAKQFKKQSALEYLCSEIFWAMKANNFRFMSSMDFWYEAHHSDNPNGNICPVHNVVKIQGDKGKYGFLMPKLYMTMYDLLNKGVTKFQRIKFFRTFLQGLITCHERGVKLSDIHQDNVMCVVNANNKIGYPQYIAVIIDFGSSSNAMSDESIYTGVNLTEELFKHADIEKNIQYNMRPIEMKELIDELFLLEKQLFDKLCEEMGKNSNKKIKTQL